MYQLRWSMDGKDMFAIGPVEASHFGIPVGIGWHVGTRGVEIVTEICVSKEMKGQLLKRGSVMCFVPVMAKALHQQVTQLVGEGVQQTLQTRVARQAAGDKVLVTGGTKELAKDFQVDLDFIEIGRAHV